MRKTFLAALGTLAVAGPGLAAEAIHDKGAATAAARRYTQAVCTERKPCRYRAERQGPQQWRVWVYQGKSREPRVILFFDRDGNLIRRIEGE